MISPKWFLQLLVISSVVVAGCQGFDQSSCEETRQSDPQFTISFTPFSVDPTLTPSQSGQPVENLVYSEYDLVGVDWPTKKMTFDIGSSTNLLSVLLEIESSTFIIVYSGDELARGEVHVSVPASGVVDRPVLFVGNSDVSGGSLSLVGYETYNLQQLGKNPPLVIADPSLDREIGQYLECVIYDRSR